ncbi:thymidine phosphorylase [Sulfitobacter mediterraneus]|uniref:Thymidine phosphorylase n=1 Tax=Sulfitobacter mediterraneus TaxID=83219 RepID=A0A2T6CFW7_9RHOB|nr:thymidine phosphorylase [Sulfitobacter mediterraneus]KIN77626.1 Thymidine phosphorylase [Sulfitobacter mediterraneus KCTC 32188]PTX74391.1 thymidine phosphorylase [Sulfitobacter mediterraneus]
MTNARTILAKLRHQEPLDAVELGWAAAALASGEMSAAQAGAFAMGICRNGLDDAGRVALTLAMRDSGQVLQWDLDGPVLDKHSTGGVGDCVSLILAPALAACGAFVPMISGRGLGHTGGTLDKLEAIPGVTTQVEEARLHDIVRQVGCAIVGATGNIAPADKRLYAVRDVTSTVDSLDLITASILSKKLAASLDGLVLDVKVGSGAFMKDLPEAQALASALTATANAAGCRTTAVISDMNQPLVPSLGNALEVAEVMRVLRGDAQGPIIDVAAALGGVLLANGGLAQDVQAGADSIVNAVRSGAAAEVFGKMLAALGGPVSFVENWQRFLPEATVIRAVKAPGAGYVTAIDGEALGLAVVDLGGGRKIESDEVNPAVGLSEVVRLGTKVSNGQTLAVVHASRSDLADQAALAVQAAMTLSDTSAQVPDLILERVG